MTCTYDSILQELRTTSDFCLYISFSGRLLAELPVEPRLGKMILFSVVLKCLDPAIVLACAMAYKDPCTHCFVSFLSNCSFFKRFKIENDQVYRKDSIYLFLWRKKHLCKSDFLFLVILPIDSADKRSLAQLKKRLVGQAYSDQLVVLKIFRVSTWCRINIEVILLLLPWN